MRIRRSKGAFDGFLLILLGMWGALVPLIGPYFDYAIGSNATWDFTWDRFWLSILPGAVVALGGFILLASRHRFRAGTGAWWALAGGIWFIVGQTVSTLWNDGASAAGTAQGGTTLRAVEQLGFFYGLGALITTLAAFALGRLAVRSVRDAAYEERIAADGPADDIAPGRFTRTSDADVDEETTPRRRFLRRTRNRA